MRWGRRLTGYGSEIYIPTKADIIISTVELHPTPQHLQESKLWLACRVHELVLVFHLSLVVQP